MEIKKIYQKSEALVSDDLISSSDDAINAAIPDAQAGMIIYNTGHHIEKQKSLDGQWIDMTGESSVNAAIAKANAAADAANTAASNADSAVEEADAAINLANTATDKANEAADAAKEAGTKAIAAATAAESASDQAEAATTKASEATGQAETAAQSATDAANLANTAATAANNATEGAEKVNISAVQTDTGADVTVTDRDGEQTTVHIDTLFAVKDWADVRNAVRLGLGEKLFPPGYEFTTVDSDTGATIVWVVRGHDKHKAANDKLAHTMTIEVKNVYGNLEGTYKSFVFDATEALYYAPSGLDAGTYHFTLLSGYDPTYGGGKTITFTLAQPIPAGGQIVFPWAYQTQATATKISTYPSADSTQAIESGIAVTEGDDGEMLGTADGKTENMNHVHRIRYGSNNYAQSAVRQWLNSKAEAGSVWKPTNKFDRAPSWAKTYNGFMHGLPSDFLDVVQTAVIPCLTNSIYEVASLDGTEFVKDQTYTLEDKFFLLSRPEIYGTWDSASYKDGELLPYYEGLTNAERIKRDAAGAARDCWLRSPYSGYASDTRIVNVDGSLNYHGAYRAYAVAPACIIA